MDPNGRAAIVTGGASGIGFATASLLGSNGVHVVLADVDGMAAQDAASKLSARGVVVHPLQIDVTKRSDVQYALTYAAAEFGRVDIVHNNAGITERGEDLFARDAQLWERVLDIDLRAVILGTQLAVQQMRSQGGGGVIVNTASMAGLDPIGASPVYSAAKAGVVQFTRTLAHLASEGIRVNAICPSFTDTPMVRAGGPQAIEAVKTLVGGILQPEQIAEGVLQLVRDDTRAGAVMRVTVRRGIDYAFERH
jgi:NAD(P)-dependent dehydrogenase (short-subunit alcohol dehydrogenase family)